MEHLGDVGGVARRAGLLRRGGEADLVVDDHVERAADGVAAQLAEVERLLDDALAGEGGVAVDQHDEAAFVAHVAGAVLLGAHDALGDGVDELEVAGIEAEREMRSGGHWQCASRCVWPRWYFTSPWSEKKGWLILELAEDLARALARGCWPAR